MENISSEQELKQLLDEGRITEEEYKELLEALRQKETLQKSVEKAVESKPRTGFGKAALIMVIVGLSTPAMSAVFASVRWAWAIGGGAFGIHVLGGNVQDPALKELFRSYFK